MFSHLNVELEVLTNNMKERVSEIQKGLVLGPVTLTHMSGRSCTMDLSMHIIDCDTRSVCVMLDDTLKDNELSLAELCDPDKLVIEIDASFEESISSDWRFGAAKIYPAREESNPIPISIKAETSSYYHAGVIAGLLVEALGLDGIPSMYKMTVLDHGEIKTVDVFDSSTQSLGQHKVPFISGIYSCINPNLSGLTVQNICGYDRLALLSLLND